MSDALSDTTKFSELPNLAKPVRSRKASDFSAWIRCLPIFLGVFTFWNFMEWDATTIGVIGAIIACLVLWIAFVIYPVHFVRENESKARRLRGVFIRHMRDLIRSNDAGMRAENLVIVDHFDQLIAASQAQMIAQRKALTEDLENAVISIYGERTRKVIDDLWAPIPNVGYELDRGAQSTVWTRGRILNMLANCSQDEASHIVSNYGRSGDYCQKLRKHVTANDLRLLNWMLDSMTRQRDALAAVCKKVNGVGLRPLRGPCWPCYMKGNDLNSMSRPWTAIPPRLMIKSFGSFSEDQDFDQCGGHELMLLKTVKRG